MNAATFTPARRGDLVVIIERHTYSSLHADGGEWTTVEFGVVTSITRDGQIKTIRRSYGTVIPAAYREQYRIVDQHMIDVPAVMAAAPMFLRSLEEARQFLQPFRATEEVAA